MITSMIEILTFKNAFVGMSSLAPSQRGIVGKKGLCKEKPMVLLQQQYTRRCLRVCSNQIQQIEAGVEIRCFRWKKNNQDLVE